LIRSKSPQKHTRPIFSSFFNFNLIFQIALKKIEGALMMPLIEGGDVVERVLGGVVAVDVF